MGQSGLEPPTSRLSVVCSSQLSYWPSSRQTPYRSLRRQRQSSLIPLPLLSKSQPLRWVAILFLESEIGVPRISKSFPAWGVPSKLNNVNEHLVLTLGHTRRYSRRSNLLRSFATRGSIVTTSLRDYARHLRASRNCAYSP